MMKSYHNIFPYLRSMPNRFNGLEKEIRFVRYRFLKCHLRCNFFLISRKGKNERKERFEIKVMTEKLNSEYES